MPAPKVIINQLVPFNTRRFDACMNYLMRLYDRNLTQHDLVKLHVMTDFFHVLKTGKQAIGGPLSPWKHGPVIKDGYDRVKRMAHKFKELGCKTPVSSGKLRVIAKKTKTAYLFDPYGHVEEDDFSPSEKEAMTRAWNFIIPKTFDDREKFFHDPTTYMGRMWKQASETKTGIDWGLLVAAYDDQENTDHTNARLMIDCWRDSA